MGISSKGAETMSAFFRFAKLLDNLLVFRKTTLLMFRKKKIAVCNDVKNAVFAFDKFRFDAKLIEYLGRQTGGLWEIVSSYTVSNRDVHCFPPFSSFGSGVCRLLLRPLLFPAWRRL